jgi:protocatechuate 3,4-dioxygenase beta subunit
MFGPVYTERLRRRWPWFLAILAGALVLGGLALWWRAASRHDSQIAPPRVAEVLEVQIEAARPCEEGDPCSQRGEPSSPASATSATSAPGAEVYAPASAVPPSPIAGALLQSWRGAPGSAVPLQRAQSDAGGHARLELAAGAEWVSIEAPGRARWSAQLPLARGLGPLRVALAPALPLHVRVIGVDGSPIAGALVLAHGDEALPQAALSSALGDASFASTGQHIDGVRVSAPGYASSSVEPSSRDVVVQLSSPGSLLVSVVAVGAPGLPAGAAKQPAGGARVWLSGLDVWPPRESSAGPDGDVVWDGLSRGSYDLRAELGGAVAIASVTLERSEHRSLTLELVPGRTIEVQVNDSAPGNAPIAGADVVLVEDGLGPFPLHGSTDAAGRVALGPLPRGSVTVNARAEGFMPESAVPVSSDALRVQLSLTRGGSVRGRVVDPAGEPIAGASLEVLGSDLRGQPIARRAWLDPLAGAAPSLASPPPLIPLGELGVLPGPLPVPGGALGSAGKSPWSSDASGSFLLQDVPPGHIRVLARHPDFVEATSAEQELAPAGEITLTLQLTRGAALSGHVTEPGGRPVARARLEAQGRHSLQQSSVLTRDDGSFELRSVPTEVDLFVARPSDRQRFVLRQSLQLRAGEARQLELTLPPERAALEVSVQGDDQRALAGALVSVLSLDPAEPLRRSLATDATGTVRIADAAGLRLGLRVQAAGFGNFETQLDAAPTRVEVSLQPAVRIVGRVTQVRGRQGLPGALIVWMQGGDRRTARSDASGEFQFGEASAGSARLRVSHPGFATHVAELSVPAMGRVDRAFELPPIDLVEAGSVAGLVLDEQGEPVRGARVGVGLVPAFLPAGAEPFGLAQSDASGQFRLDEVPVGRVTISAYAAAVGRGSIEDLEVRAGESAGPVEIILHPGNTDPGSDAHASVAITLGERPSSTGVEVVIVNVAAGSEAERADLRAGDVLRAVDGWDVRGMAEARRYLGGSDGSDVIVELDRDGEWLSLDVRREAVRR